MMRRRSFHGNAVVRVGVRSQPTPFTAALRAAPTLRQLPTSLSKQRMPSKAAPRPSKPTAHPARDAADALYRTARESCHQHERLTRLLSHGADQREFAEACALADLCDSHLAAHTVRYEEAGVGGRGGEPEEWYKAANALWMASREYGRRHTASDAVASRSKRHTSAQLGEITMEYELELSARIALKQALAAYGAVHGDAH